MGEALQSQIQCYLHHPNQEPDKKEQIAPECQTLKAHTSTENGDQGFAASFTIPIEKSMLDSLIRVLLTTSRYNFTVQNNCEEKLWSKVMLHFEQTPQQQFAFQGKCLDRESHLFEHSLQPKFFLGFPGHQSHQVPRHHQLSSRLSKLLCTHQVSANIKALSVSHLHSANLYVRNYWCIQFESKPLYY
jgi:hypothetical protein